MTPHPLLRDLDAIYVINLPSREDRRREIAAELARVGLALETPPVKLFPAVRPDAPAGFPSVGARGCFLSHLGVLRDAARQGFGRILILEDDAEVTPDFIDAPQEAGRAAETGDLVYFGYTMSSPLADDRSLFPTVSPDTDLRTSHAIVMGGPAIERLIPYLEAMLTRPAGDPAGGPMHVDGAYNRFRRDNPDIRTLAAQGRWIIQRSSQSDIAPGSWKDRLPMAAHLRRLRARIRRLRG